VVAIFVFVMANFFRHDERGDNWDEVQYRMREEELSEGENYPGIYSAHPEMSLVLPVQINQHELQRRKDIFGIHDHPPYPYTRGCAIYLHGVIPVDLRVDPLNPPNVLDFVFPCENKAHHPVLLPQTIEAEKFLKVMRMALPCYSCDLCPTFVSQHHHEFGEACNSNCVICK
jgi:hypothetical protein